MEGSEAPTETLTTGPDHHVEGEQKVTQLELFFDLVFVFAFTQVTALMTANPTWEGLGQGLLVLAAVWWAWSAYAFLTDLIASDDGRARLVIFSSMAAMLVAALAIPGAFGDDALLFGIAYFAVRALHIVAFAHAADDVDIVAAVKAIAPTAFGGPALIIAASAFDGGAQASLWLVALIVDYAGPRFGPRNWRVSPGHFAERYGLIMIIVIGESIVAVGIGLGGVDLGPAEVVGAMAGVGIAAALWWAYFDVAALLAERRLRGCEGEERARLAMDGYAYIHPLMVAGIVLVAFGLKKALGHVDAPLDTVPAVALCGGAALYLLGHVAFKLRMTGSVGRERIVGAVICLALIPLATSADALLAVIALLLATGGVVAFETLRYRETRGEIRSTEAGETA